MRTPEPRLPSPLVQRTAQEPVPRALSLSRYILCDGTHEIGDEPLTVRMPPLQWAYGLLFPIDHGALPRNLAGQSYVATVKLVVDGGTVGVAACNFDGSKFTAAEIFAKGTAEAHVLRD